ncbi:MAG: GTP pyrophosphokinase family protein [Gaiellales bacterium]|nr:GTP pyrophosphokinase family protein [Gaiellales bacterium]
MNTTPFADPETGEIPTSLLAPLHQIRGLRQMLVMYSCGIREVQTKLEILNDEFQVKRHRSPIESIKSRVKEPESIARKLHRRGLEMSAESIVANLNDVAGIRVVCPFIKDIYFVANTLLAQDDITLSERKDYIAEPKANGYRSLHLVVEVPVFFSDRKQPVRVEVQIRTIAMDFWASLEHEIRYKKKDLPNSDAVAQDLRECAEIISQTDLRMQEIHRLLGPSTLEGPPAADGAGQAQS